MAAAPVVRAHRASSPFFIHFQASAICTSRSERAGIQPRRARAREIGRSNEDRGIACPPWRRLRENRCSADALRGGNNLPDGIAARVGKVNRAAFSFSKQIINGAEMSLSNIHY